MSSRSAVDRFETLSVGQRAERTHTVTDADIKHFAAATGDDNPIHMDEAAGQRSIFGRRIAHGMLSAGFISAAIGTELPGAGTVYLSQSLRFLRPVRIGDAITAQVEVREIEVTRRRITLATKCVNQQNETVLDGEAVVMLPRPA